MSLAARLELRSAARRRLWREGRPTQFLLDEGQRGWVQRANENDANGEPSVWNIGRQRGKTFAALADACEFALNNAAAIIRYCALTKDSAIGIVEPNLAIILEDCPKELRPRIVSSSEDDDEGGVLQRRRLQFPSSKSELIVFGTDAQSFRKGRGPRTHRQLLDEVGFYQELEAVEAALIPALQTTNGGLWYLSSPPETPAHPYAQRIATARARGRLEHDTFWNNPRVDPERIIRTECVRLGLTREELLKSTYFRREYLAELVLEETRAAVPGWQLHSEKCIEAVPRPTYFDGMVGLDFGFGDPHGVALGYWDFVHNWLVIEHELQLRQGNTQQLVEAAKQLEVEAWGSKSFDGTLLGAEEWRKSRGWKDWPEYLRTVASEKAPRQPYLRVGDDDQLVLADLRQLHGYAVLPSQKDGKALQVNELDILVRQHRFKVHPRCKHLIRELGSTVWNKARTEWERTAEGHGDVLDACLYMMRNANRHRDPRPAEPVDPWLRQTAKARNDEASGRKTLGQLYRRR